MVIYLLPTNLSQLEQLSRDITYLYDINRREKFDEVVFTFIQWPDTFGDGHTSMDLESYILALFKGKLDLKSQVYILNNPQYHDDSEVNSTSTSIYEVYGIRGETVVQIVGSGRLDFESWTFTISAVYQRRRNLNGVLITANAVNNVWEQLTLQFKETNETVEFSGGFAYNLFRDMGHSLNFSSQAMRSDEYLWEDENGTLMGMAAQLYNGDADISITVSYFLAFRVKKLTPLFPVMVHRPLAFFRQPDIGSHRDIYKISLSKEVWLAMLSTISLIVLSILFSRVDVSKGGSSDSKRNLFPTILESVLWTICAVCQKSWWYDRFDHRSMTISAKILALTVTFASLMCYAYYSGIFTAGLAFESQPVNNMADLVFFKFKFLFDFGFYIYFFDIHECPHFHESDVVPTADEDNYCTSPEVAIQKTFETGFAWVSPDYIFHACYLAAGYTDEEMCKKISMVSFGRGQVFGTFFVQKGSEFKEVFNVKIMHLKERGIIDRYWKLDSSKPIISSCPDKSKIYRGELGIQDVLSGLLFAIVGLPLSLGYLVAECLYKRLQRN